MTTAEVITHELTVIEIGREYPFFFDRTPSPVPPVQTKDPYEVRVYKEVVVDGRQALMYTGVCKITQRDTICRPFVVINFADSSESDRGYKAIIKVGGFEYTSEQTLHKVGYIMETNESPLFIEWIDKNGKSLTFETPIEAEALASAMTFRLEKSTPEK